LTEQALMLARLSSAPGMRPYATHMADHDIEHLAQMAACRAASASPPR
jgi:hypothetical protein